MHYCFSVLASATNQSIWIYLTTQVYIVLLTQAIHACGTWQLTLHKGEPSCFCTFLCVFVATHVTARGVRVITMKRHIWFGSMRGKEGTGATFCFMSKRSIEWFNHCQGTESTAETLKMPFIIVHSDLAVASLRLHETGSHAKRRGDTVSKSSCGISE